MSPDAEWQEDKATAEVRWILGGRFLMQEVLGPAVEAGGEHKGQRFEGLGIIGYDSYTQKYTSSWRDTMTTMTFTSTGTCDKSGKEFTFIGEYDDVMTGGKKKERTVIRIINANKHVWESYGSAPDGTEYWSMEITYNRK
jgi:hypothetical protein